jgi:desampylase
MMALILEAPEFTFYDIEMAVRISREVLDRILADAAEDGLERCGLLLGEGNGIRDVRFAANIAPDPARHFELDPAVLLAAHKGARAGGLAILGHYHSHPSGKSVPSVTDAQCAAADDSLWLIVGGADAALWRAVAEGPLHGRFQAERMEIYGDVALA